MRRQMKKNKLILVLMGLLAEGYFFYWKNENKHLSIDFVDGAINGKNLLINHLNPESAK